MKVFTRFIFLFLAAILLHTNAMAQAKGNLIVTGRVLDQDTGNPLEAVSIYFAQTTIGTTADKKGQFSLEVTKPGNYEMVVSMVGYELQKISMFIQKGKNYEYQIKLVPKTLELETVEIIGDNQIEWKRNMEIFKRRLLGEIASANDCTIQNLEFVNFKRDAGIITAVCPKPIIITSPYLGYEITAEISSFYYNRGSNMLEYSFLPRYKELTPSDQEQKDKWETNRARIYFGSPEHFLWALKNEKLITEGFFVYPTFALNFSMQNIAGETPIKSWKDILLKDQAGNQELLSFTGYLKVIYKKLLVSCIKLKAGFFTIDDNGRTDNHLPFECSGYWAKYGVASRLPTDYLPEKLKK
ncbi:MAG: hypothetical protein C0412_03980 [Flavobacterium sp.]|nr:hypothetical protein [Flavobacterium sp.]